MNITEVKVLPVDGDERLKAFVSMKIDDCFVVRDMKIISGDTGFFVAMPRRSVKYQDLLFMSHSAASKRSFLMV